MKIIKLKESDIEARKAYHHEHENYFEAMWSCEAGKNFRGCPCGSSTISEANAIQDLINRTEIESQVKIEIILK
jgi:hypothetical protein